MKYLILFFLLLSSCSVHKTNESMKRRRLGEYFNGTGVVRYFLSDLPDWANFSQTGACKRSLSPRYFNISTLRKSFSYDYEQAVQFQYMYNIEVSKLKLRTDAHFLPFEDEEKLFFSLSDKIQANIRAFRPPTYKRVHLIWIDPFFAKKGSFKSLSKLLEKEETNLGHPVLVSLCFNYLEMDKLLERDEFNQRNIRYIPYEMFSPYDEEGNFRPFFQLNFSQVFKQDKQKLYLYLPKGQSIPKEFVGEFKIKRY